MLPSFEENLEKHGVEIKRGTIKTLQVNIGKRCNQACHHCHVESGPNHPDNMELKTVDRLLHLLKNQSDIETVDITGGAPELNPHFRYFVTEIRKMGKDVIDRCNLTVLFEDGQEDTPEFLAENKVHIISSLPCYSEANVDQQRGLGTFDKSIKALQTLGKLGYGKDRILHLVYNPLSASLPPAQKQLELDYKKELFDNFGIEFNSLFVMTNMPIKRFEHALARDGQLKEYAKLLFDNFNVKATDSLMCRELISIGWDGKIYDCDFNQMLEITSHKTIWDIENFNELDNSISFDNHCYGCTAGAGSSCSGALE